MILIIGLSVFGIAALLAVLGVAGNDGSAHSVSSDFALFGQHITGLSTGQLFLFGIIVGLVAALGVNILRGFFIRSLANRDLQKELKKSRAETETLKSDLDRLQKEVEAQRVQNLVKGSSEASPSGQGPLSTN